MNADPGAAIELPGVLGAVTLPQLWLGWPDWDGAAFGAGAVAVCAVLAGIAEVIAGVMLVCGWPMVDGPAGWLAPPVAAEVASASRLLASNMVAAFILILLYH